jgi:hypothetical protein
MLPLTTAAAASGSSSSRTGNPADPTATGVRANLTLDEVLITVAPKPLNTSSSSSSEAAAAAAAGVSSNSTTTQLLQQQLGDDAEGLGLLGQIGVLDGISLIAGALEAQLQRLSLAATNITVRLEVPPAAAAASASQQTAAAAAAAAAAAHAAVGAAAVRADLILHAEALHFYDATAQQQQQQHSAAQPAAAAAGQQGTVPAAAELVKCVSVTGLTLELLDLQEEDEQAECEQGSGLAASQLLDPASFVSSSSSTTFQQQQQHSPRQQSPRQQSSHVRCSQHRGARGSCSSSSSSRYMTRSSMLRSSWMAESTGAAVAEQADSWQQQQQCLDGLLLGGSGSSAGLDFKVELRLALPAAAAGGPASGSASTAAAAAAAGPRITADINSSPVSIVLQPWQLPLLELVSTAAAAAAASAPAYAAAGAAGAAAAGPARRQQGSPTQQQQQQEWGTRSLVEDLFFPRCEGLVASYLSFGGSNGSNLSGLSSSRAWQQQQQQDQAFGGANLLGSGLLGDVGSGLYNSVTTGDTNNDGMHSDMYSSMYNSSSSSSVRVGSVYHDARSVFVSNNSSSGLLGQSMHNYNTSGSGGSSLPVLQQLPQAPNPWASQQQQQQPLQQQQQRVAPAAAVWSVRGCIAAVTVALHYDVTACAAAAAAAAIKSPKRQQQQQQDQQPPRFVIQCSGLVASLDLAGKGRHIKLKCYCLEASEYLPVAWGLADPQLARLNPGVLGAVPKAVPAVQGTSSGLSHQVGEHVFGIC